MTDVLLLHFWFSIYKQFSVVFFSRFLFVFFFFFFMQLTTVTVAKEFAVLLCESVLFIRSQGKQNSCMGYYGI